MRGGDAVRVLQDDCVLQFEKVGSCRSMQDLCDKWVKVLENQAQVDLLDEQHGICKLDI